MTEALALHPSAASHSNPIEETRAFLGEFFARHDRVYLAFSGGRNSVALAHLCEPWRDCLTLVWLNTGEPYAHIADFVKGYGARFDLCEVRGPDIVAHWQEFGLPAEIAPVGLPDSGRTKVQAWTGCCRANRHQPLASMLRDAQTPCGYLLGSRGSAWLRDLAALNCPEQVEAHAPMLEWSDDVLASYLMANSLDLPEHYAHGVAGLDCGGCPIAMTPAKLAYLRQRYPREAETARQLVVIAVNAAQQAAHGLLLLHDASTPRTVH